MSEQSQFEEGTAADPLQPYRLGLRGAAQMPAGETGDQGAQIDARTVSEFVYECLSPNEAVRFTARQERLGISEAAPRILGDPIWRAAFDEYLIRKATPLHGPAILLGFIPRARIFAWLYHEPDGREKWKRFSKALDTFAAVQRNEKAFPLSKDLYESREDLIDEMKHLLALVKAKPPQRYSYPVVADLILAIAREHDFRRLGRNFRSLAAFLCALPSMPEKEMLRISIANLTISPADFVGAWLGVATNRNIGKLRTTLSKLHHK